MTYEEKRLKTLQSYHILDTLAEEEFDNLTTLAAEIANTPISIINLIGRDIQYSKSISGLDIETGLSVENRRRPKKDSVCRYTVQEHKITEIKNLADDARFSHIDLVQGEKGLRYYLGIPLLSEGKYAIGTLCVLDYEEKELSETQIRHLKIIAKQVMTHLELRRQNRVLEDLNEYKVKLMKMLSHDMRSPLNGIIGLSGMLKQMDESGNSEQLELLEIIEQSSNQLNQMIDEVMSYTIIESDGLQLEPKETDLQKVLDGILTLYKPAAKLKEINLQHYTDNLEAPLFIDGDKLEQIIGNLLSNSLKYTMKGGGVKISLVRKSTTAASYLELVVTDTGVGMDRELVRKLQSGKKIERLGKGTDGEKSTGIGLNIVRHFVDLFKGELNIESRPNSGSLFSVKIPV